METSPDERAARLLDYLEPTASLPIPAEAADELNRRLRQAVDEAVRRERAGLRTTLRMCLAVLEDALVLKNTPRPFRAVVRVCKVLCLDALEEGVAEAEPAIHPASPA
jgi:hypothetical protein